jgi:hypothetical protein
MNTLTCIQPSFIPWIGYFNLIKYSDCFVFLDDVQYTRRDWRNRNRLKTIEGKTHYLTIPVKSKHNFLAPINTIKIKEIPTKLLRFIQYNYKKAPYFTQIYTLLHPFLAEPPPLLSQLCIDITLAICNYLEIKNSFYRSSSFQTTTTSPVEKIIELCKQTNSTHYISGVKGENYLKETLFKNANLSLSYQNFKHPTYPQTTSAFTSHLSIIDLLFNTGPKAINYI